MINFMVDMGSLVEIEAALGEHKDKSKQVLKSAINTTAKQTVDLLVSEANREHIIRKPSSVRKTLEIKKARVGNLEAIIKSSGRVNELYSFSVTPRAYTPKNRPKAGHKGNVNRANAPGQLRYTPGQKDKHKAFTVKFKSGHISIAQRIPGSHRGQANAIGESAPPRPSHPNGEEAIKTLFSPSIPNMLGYEQGVFGFVKPRMYDLLQQNIQAQIHRYLG